MEKKAFPFSFTPNPMSVKIVIIVLMTLAFLFPLAMLESMVADRRAQSSYAIDSTAESWAGSSVLYSPFLAVPCEVDVETIVNGVTHKKIDLRTIWFAAESSDWSINIDTETRSRGIFPVVLLSSSVSLNADFALPGSVETDSIPGRLRLDQAEIVIPISSFQSIKTVPAGSWNNTPLNHGPRGISLGDDSVAFSWKTDLSDWRSDMRSFSISTALKGTRSVQVNPQSMQSRVRMTSSWKSPEFFGTALPDERVISDSGFTADWTSNGFQRIWPIGLDKKSSGFGVRFYQPLVNYALLYRAIQYGLLLLILPFIALFLFETLTDVRIHPVQYALVGLANTLFFLLLLAASEHLSFALSYILAALAVIVLLVWYIGVVIPKSFAARGIMGGLLAVLYGFLYFALTSEDYALLIGAIGLFVILLLIMILTRKIKWYQS